MTVPCVWQFISADCCVDRCSEQRCYTQVQCSYGIATSSAGNSIDHLSCTCEDMTMPCVWKFISADCGIDRCSEQRCHTQVQCSYSITTSSAGNSIDHLSCRSK